jgi:hypothetical protein
MALAIWWFGALGIAMAGALLLAGPSVRTALVAIPRAVGISSQQTSLPPMPLIVSIAAACLGAVAAATAAATTLFNILAPRCNGVRIEVLELEHTDHPDQPDVDGRAGGAPRCPSPGSHPEDEACPYPDRHEAND